jgi:DNA-binding XRE family transcriptional regulator
VNIPTVKTLRTELNRSQKGMAELLGVSQRAIQSYEQGWRRVPPHVEQMLLLQTILHRHADLTKVPRCYELKKCPPEIRQRCPAARVRPGGFCWMITGSLCCGRPTGSWSAKRQQCLDCKVLKTLLESKPLA